MAALVLLLLVLVAVPAVALLRPAATVIGEESVRLAAAHRSMTRWQVVGMGVGVVAAGLVATIDGLGRGLLLAPAVLTLGVLMGVVGGQLRISAPDGPVRSAGLAVRRVGDHLPLRLTAAVVAVTVLLVLVLLLTTALGSPDDLGRSGRALMRQCSATSGESRGPWPGSFYSLPLAATVLTGLALAAFTLRRIVQRPAQGEDPAVDADLRIAATRSVTAAVGLLVSVPLIGVALLSAQGLLGISCGPVWWDVVGIALLLTVPLLLTLAVWCTACLVLPLRRSVTATSAK